MRIRRIFASDMRQAMSQVKEELGPDAVILSSTRQEGGVEVVAAVDVADGDTVPTPDPGAGGVSSSAPAMETEAGDDGEALTYQRPRRPQQPPAAAAPTPPSEPTTEAPSAAEPSFREAFRSASQAIGDETAAGAPEEAPREMPPKAPWQTMDWEEAEPEEPAAAPGPTEQGSTEPGPEGPAAAGEPPRLDRAAVVGESRPSQGGTGAASGAMLTAVREELDILQGLLDDLNDPDAPPAKAMGTSPTAGRTEAARSAAADFLREEPDRGERRVDLTATGEALRRTLQEAVLPPRRDVMSLGGVVALVGPTGVGKTTTVAKLAARYALRHGYDQVALVTTDSYRIAAHEQLRTYARILGIPVRVANDENELRTTLDNLADRSLVLIDTAGMSQRDRRLAEQFRTLVAGAPAVQTYAVLAANTQAATLDEVVGAFQGAELDGCVLTKLDECTSLGGILSTIMERHLPLAFFSDGQRVPEDIYPATPELIAERVEALAGGTETASLSSTGGPN